MHALNKRFLFSRLLRNEAPADTPPAGGAPAAEAPATPPVATPAVSPGADSQVTAPAWHESIQDAGLKAFIEGKGFKDAGEAVKALQDLEGQTAKPESADAYKLPVPEGQDGAFATEAAKWMHEAGIPVAQAQALATKWNEYQADQAEAADKARQQQGEADVASLRKEWGGQYDANVELGKRAVRTFVGEGRDAEALLGSIEGAIGAGQLLRLFHRIGANLGEGSLTPNGDDPGHQPEPKDVSELLYPSMAKKA
ncbi:hypothetical protein [Achromobacter insolitus]|uniref:Uncharacterized protein n=1 Tax=Achromobacter insolitus TaxID=217204 RepID=A0A6S7F019_9BURK|nr:hypothetical protein [Achromobacter insolitus]CAB3931632.1 hypothetical protein LMG6000_02251 [Achromobacter insolitus]CAB3939503.1 hypothetical protein LMG5997_04068 [Achromobacter insolitus]